MNGQSGADELHPPRTSRRWRIIVIVLLAVVLAPASWLARRVASRLEFFHLRSVEVRGTRYLSPEIVLERLAVDTMRSVWDDTRPLVARLDSMAQIGAVDISRRLPGTLVISISENLPVALAPSSRGLEAVDSAGVVLPIDLSMDDLDLPVAGQRDVPLLALLGAVRAGQPAVYRRISEITRDGKRDVIFLLRPRGSPSEPTVADSSLTDSLGRLRTPTPPRTLKVRAQLGVSVSRLADIFPVESDLLRRRANVAELDLRYRDQVIARLQ